MRVLKVSSCLVAAALFVFCGSQPYEPPNEPRDYDAGTMLMGRGKQLVAPDVTEEVAPLPQARAASSLTEGSVGKTFVCHLTAEAIVFGDSGCVGKVILVSDNAVGALKW